MTSSFFFLALTHKHVQLCGSRTSGFMVPAGQDVRDGDRSAEGELLVFTSSSLTGNLFHGQPIVPGCNMEIYNVFIVNMWRT